HCQFADNDFLCQFGEATCSPQPTITAQAQQATTFSLLLPWLNFYLKNDCASGDEFQNLISVGNGITSAQNCSLICTGVEEKNDLTFITIYPNPVEGITTVFSKQYLSDAELFIYDAAGKKVKVLKNISGYEMKVDVNDLCDGFYFISLKQKDKLSAMHKLIIAQ
ncbi:MAG: T9SS type A sorting domain-containing protein, partial [Bacteroidota bacterium]